MRNLLLIAGAAALASAGPAIAGPGKAKAKQGKPVATMHHPDAHMQKHGGHICPPGLLKKTPSCVPPGQAGTIGGRLPTGWGMTDWDDIPLSIRNQYTLDDDWRYAYYGNRLYVVDPTTELITRIINGIRF